jgi:hypothetical protein
MPVSAVVLMAGAPSAAYAQCFQSFITSTSYANMAFLPSGSAFLSSSPDGASGQQGGGMWTRAVVGEDTTQIPTNFNGSFTVTPPGGHSFPIAFSQPRPGIDLRPDVPGQYAEVQFRVAGIENRDVVTNLIAFEVGLYW